MGVVVGQLRKWVHPHPGDKRVFFMITKIHHMPFSNNDDGVCDSAVIMYVHNLTSEEYITAAVEKHSELVSET